MKTRKSLRILGIETSCDETAANIIEVAEDGKGFRILGDAVHSQIDIHASYGGVFPTLAKREHERNLIPTLESTLRSAGLFKKANEDTPLPEAVATILARETELLSAFKGFIPSIERPDIDLISVTVGPGLEPALWVGINFARALATVWGIPLVPVNHMEGHILAALIERTEGDEFRFLEDDISYPAISLLISGGHTEIVLASRSPKGALEYRIVGATKDDAVGECFDKIARTLGLPYPGGPKISKLAAEARERGIASPEPLPRPMIASKDLDFSFSGLKTAVLYLVRRLAKDGELLPENIVRGIAREAEDAIVDVLAAKMRRAIEAYAPGALAIGGGVIANARIREALETLAAESSLPILMPEPSRATDNGLMIALAGYFGRSKAVGASVPQKAIGTLPIGPRDASASHLTK